MGNTGPRLDWVHMERFRNYRDETLKLSPRFTVLSGPNAQGKTNALEAIHLLSTTRLLRGQKDSEAILEGEESAFVEGCLLSGGTTISVQLAPGVRKKVALNGLGLPRAADVIGRLPMVCVTSVDMALARGEPAARRLALDLELSGLSQAYLRHLTLYRRALEQRNALLRHSETLPPAEQLEPWEEQMAEHGVALRLARIAYFADLVGVAKDAHAEIGDGEDLVVTYEAKDESITANELREALAGMRREDQRRGGASSGPHRDDFSLTVAGRDVRAFGSQGQQRTAVIGVKLGMLRVAADQLGFAPLLLLDDILSDLDEKRRARLIDAVLRLADQALLTCTEAAAAGEKILDQAWVYTVEAGKLARA